MAVPSIKSSAPTSWLRAHLASRNVARVIYGTIVGLALVDALEAHPPRPWVIVSLLIGTALAVGLADFYAELISTEARQRRLPGREEVAETAKEAIAVMLGVALPAIFFGLAAVGVFDNTVALATTEIVGLTMIFAYGFLSARLAGFGTAAGLLHGGAIVLIGVALIALRTILK